MKKDNAVRGSENPVERQLRGVLAKVPPLFKLPKPGARCPYTGQSRTGLIELIAPAERNNYKPPVPAGGIYRKAHKYAKRGTWTLVAEPIFHYLLTEAGNSTATYIETSKARNGK